ncbi:hypothetical protein JK358_32550 [Nocardia sp. 2]|uniref:Uncharacterized protein n=1 Tax=Nocardia acididurans TaxID=2802282 RepID=A0ABS1MER3_9NOCA|nr:hypothetical protein [Nocardia acididurans]MBL1079145.1 hypothetical protein [Nocardia acididurans]
MLTIGMVVAIAGCSPDQAGTQVDSPVAGAPKVETTPRAQPVTTKTGTVALQTATPRGTAIPYVPVSIRRYEPCDPGTRNLSEGASEVGSWDGVTDLAGQAVFTDMPVGCYRFGMVAPSGTNPVPEGMHTLFVESAGQTVNGQLRFQDPAPVPTCAAQTFVHDLNVGQELRSATTQVSVCEELWAVVSWDVPGDSQRVVARTIVGPWRDYVRFPHDVCWSTAKSDGAPDTLKKYFTAC